VTVRAFPLCCGPLLLLLLLLLLQLVVEPVRDYVPCLLCLCNTTMNIKQTNINALKTVYLVFQIVLIESDSPISSHPLDETTSFRWTMPRWDSIFKNLISRIAIKGNCNRVDTPKVRRQ
jgi:hypothetical protein